MNQFAGGSTAPTPGWGSLAGIGMRPLGDAPAKSRPAIRLFTRGLARPLQYAAWREQLAPILDSAASTAAQGFLAEMEAWNLGDLVLVRTRAPQLAYRRSLRQCRSDGLDHWLVSAVARPDGPRQRRLELWLRGLDTPFAGRAPAGEAVHMVLPQAFLGPGLSGEAPISAGNGAEIDTPLGRRLAGFLLDLSRHLPEFSHDDCAALAASLRAMLLACLAAAPGTTAAPPALELGLLERARRLVQQRLHSPALGVDMLCRELGVSRSRLYRLFEPLGGVIHYIRSRRLLDAHAALADAEDGRAIVAIAAERGFSDPAEFSRAFKRAFGYRPSEARRRGLSRPPRPPLPEEISGHTLAELLRRLA